ncbi:unannotated protein [freshwater metagenome]|uniref:Unannotated protein n=1 Tax=freshwater metagenome TaxID=449393 RepID=A0A6J7GBZ5_9ZZZZ
MPGVHDPGDARRQVHLQHLAGDELPRRQVPLDRLAGDPGLGAEVRTRPALVAQAAHQQGRQQGRRDVVAHGVGDRHPQLVPVQRPVEGVAAHGRGRFQPARHGELPGLAGEGGGQQPALDLRGQGERRRPLAPLEQVGVPPVGDQHVGQRMTGGRDVGEHLGVGLYGQHQLEHAERVAAVGDRDQHAAAGVEVDDRGPLGAQHLAVVAALQGDGVGAVRARPAGRGAGGRDRAQPDQGVPGEVGDQEGDGPGAQRGGQLGGHHHDGVHRGSGLDPLQQGAQIKT